MARSGRHPGRHADLMESKVRPGVTTGELDAAAERFIRSQGAIPTFKGYRGFPGSICASPNAMIVHGIPGKYKLTGGDIISIDVGVTLDGWVADAARTFPVERDRPAGAEPAERHPGVAARGRCPVPCGQPHGRCLKRHPAGGRGRGPRVVRSLVGHGVGRSMHEDPQVPNYGKPGKGPLLEEGMVLAIEPMTTAGRPGGAGGRRQLGDLLPGWLPGGPLRVHRGHHRRRSAGADALASGARGARRRAARPGRCRGRLSATGRAARSTACTSTARN